MGYEGEGENAIRRTADRLFVEFAYRKKKETEKGVRKEGRKRRRVEDE